MAYRCPLCLKELDKDEFLYRFCTKHPDSSKLFRCSPADLVHEMFCQDEDCDSVGHIVYGVLLRHENCEALNPFWDGKEVVIPGSPDDGNTIMVPVFDGIQQNVRITHWQIGMLRKMRELYPQAKEMWFPLMLLRATKETNSLIGRRRIGVMVELVGAMEAGKTVIALQSMDQQGYVNGQNGKNRRIQRRDYLFSRNPVGAATVTNPLLRTLYLRYLMENNEPDVPAPEGTKKEPGDIKTVFIKPAPHKEQPTPSNETRVQKWKRRMARVSKWVNDRIKSGVNSPFWYTVAFYDLAGESIDRQDHVYLSLRKKVDKVAIVVPAPDILKGDGVSLGVAFQRISDLGEHKLPCALVVTQVDRSFNALPPDEQKKVRKLADDMALTPEQHRISAKRLLQDWLSRLETEKNKDLLGVLDKIDEVFFVWTINLAAKEDARTVAAKTGLRVVTAKKSSKKTINKQPVSYGLAKLISWCLGINWEDIDQQ